MFLPTGRFGSSAFLFLALSFLLFSGVVQAAGTLSGKVVDAADGVTPITAVQVELFDPETGNILPQYGVSTNEDGRYVMSGIPAGDYKVHFNGDWYSEIYLDELYDGVVCVNGNCDVRQLGNVFAINDGENSLDVDLEKGIVVSGKVTYQDGSPVEGSTVNLYDANGYWVNGGYSYPDGLWAIPLQQNGVYYAFISDGHDLEYEYVPQVWNGKACDGCDPTTTGDPIVVNGLDVEGIDFQLAKVDDGSGGGNTGIDDPSVLSGSWFNPDRSGEGFGIQILDNNQVLVIWYTYPGSNDDQGAEQRFILGTGTIDGSVIQVKGAYRTHGPVFGDDYDKNDLVIDEWGDITIEFSSRDTARLHFQGDDGSGSTEIVRLTNLVDPAQDGSLPSSISAGWYDPETSGQGWFVEILSKTNALVYWYSYDENGNQLWNLGTGEILGNSITVGESYLGKGTRFGDQFKAEDVVLETFATMQLSFKDCDSGTVSYFTENGEAIGMLPITRLTNLTGHVCSDFGKGEDIKVTLLSNPTDPLMMRAENSSGMTFDFVGRRDSEGGLETAKGVDIRLPSGEENSVRFNEDGSEFWITDEQTGDTLRYSLDHSGGINISVQSGDGRVSASHYVAPDQVSNQGATQKNSVSPAQTQSAKPGIPKIQSDAAHNARIAVNYCGTAFDSADVRFRVVDKQAGADELYRVSAKSVSPGVFEAPLMSYDQGPIYQAVQDQVCAGSTQWDVTCGTLDLLDWKGGAEDLIDIDWLPKKFGSEIPDPATLLCAAATVQNKLLGIACSATSIAIGEMCDAYGAMQDRCSVVHEHDIIFREYAGRILSVQSAVRLPNGKVANPAPKDFPAGNFVDFGVINVEGDPQVIKTQFNPEQPAAGSSYELTLESFCTSPGDRFRVVGTNPKGVPHDKTCDISTTNGTCSIQLPTLENQSVDTLKITLVGDSNPDNAIERTITLAIPEPELVSPISDGVQSNSCSDTATYSWNFDWTDVSGAILYEIEISGPGVDPVSSYTQESRITLEGFGKKWEGEDLFGWEWRVRAISASKVPGAWSELRQFKLGDCVQNQQNNYSGPITLTGISTWKDECVLDANIVGTASTQNLWSENPTLSYSGTYSSSGREGWCKGNSGEPWEEQSIPLSYVSVDSFSGTIEYSPSAGALIRGSVTGTFSSNEWSIELTWYEDWGDGIFDLSGSAKLTPE